VECCCVWLRCVSACKGGMFLFFTCRLRCAAGSDEDEPGHGGVTAGQQGRRIMALISKLSGGESADLVKQVCHDLARLLLDNPEHRRHIIPNHGVLPFVDILESPDTPSVVLASVLRVVNLITRDDKRLQEAVSLVGALPAVLFLTRQSSAMVVRLYVADFINQLCKTSTVTLQMLVACGGIQVRERVVLCCVVLCCWCALPLASLLLPVECRAFHAAVHVSRFGTCVWLLCGTPNRLW